MLGNRWKIWSFIFQVTEPEQIDSIITDVTESFNSSTSVIGELIQSKDADSLNNVVAGFVSLVNMASGSSAPSNSSNMTAAEKEAFKNKQADRMEVCQIAKTLRFFRILKFRLISD